MTFDLSILLRDVVKLFPLLLIQKAEVKGMILNEYNEEDVMNGFKEEAMEEGVRKGMLSTLTGLVADNLLSIREASQRANVSEDDFVKLMHVYQTHILQTRSAYARRPRSGRAHSWAQRRVCPQGIAPKAVRIEPQAK